jgi:Cytosine deaminase and related metal-dependent hydrolases
MQPQPCDLLVCPRWLVPILPRGRVLEEHAMVIDGERILAVLPRAFAEQSYAPRRVLDLPEHAVMPGLVNAHTHAAMTLLRGLADDLPLMRWLTEHIWPAESRHVGAAFCRDGARLALAEMIRGGQTCFNDMYFFPEVTAEVAGEAGMRATLGMIVIDFPTAWASDADRYIAQGLELHDRLQGHPLLRTAFAPHAPYTVSDAPLERIVRAARELGVPVHMHVHETAQEVAEAVARSGERPWARLRRLSLLDTDLIAVHMTTLDEDEIAEAAERAVSVVHCPESNLKLASGFAPVARLLAAGVNVALGTDGAASNNDLDLHGEMRTAALLAKAVAGDASALPAAQALHMATLGGARALRRDDEIGSLEAGKQADFIAIDLSAAETQPIYDVLSHLVYAASRQHVTHTFVAGRPLMEDRRLTTIDLPATLAHAAEWRARIVAGNAA